MKRLALISTLILGLACGGSEPAGVNATAPSAKPPGPLADTWTWNGTRWQVHAGAGPSARYSAAVAYDAGRQEYVLYGGLTSKGTSDDTWTWGAGGWKLRSPAHKPPPLRDAAMAYDPQSAAVVMFGGHYPNDAEGMVSGDTWIWNGVDWSRSATGDAVGPREGARLVRASGHVLLIGGHQWNDAYYADVWAWDGTSWSRVQTHPVFPGRGNAAVVSDPARSAVIVYGGTGFNADGGPGALGTPLKDGWSLTHDQWSALPAGPPALAFANALWDTAHDRSLIVFGIQCPDLSDATWAWDGGAWSKLPPPDVPARWGAALAQAPDGTALLFGGDDETGC